MTDYDDLTIAILAAGDSRRMGSPKQLLDVGGETLLERAVKCAVESVVHNVTVVLGASAEQYTPLMSKTPAQILINPDWAFGMGNTLKFSLRKLIEENINIQGVLFMVCDQPLITSAHVNAMVRTYQEKNPVAVASGYKNTFGVPALFDRIAFSGLLSIDDKSGAREVLKKLESDLEIIPVEGGEIDLDTPEDYQKFMNMKKS